MRIGDRNLINSVHSDDFLGQPRLRGTSPSQIASDKGQSVWTSTMDGEVRAEPGCDHRLPGDGGGRRLKPGVYVMFAKPIGRAGTRRLRRRRRL